jgi:hypothetical protein
MAVCGARGLGSVVLMSRRLSSARRTLTHALAVATTAIVAAASKPATAAPFARLEGDTLVLGNDRVSRTYELTARGLEHVALTDSVSSRTHPAGDSLPLFGEDYLPLRHTFTSRTLPADSIRPERLVAELDLVYPDLTLRREFELTAHTPAVRQTWWIKIHSDADRARVATLPHAALPLDRLPLHAPHWRVRSVEFFDRTDERDNLTRHESRLAFNHAETLRGNLFWIEPLAGGPGVFWLKEAPAAESQLAHPGHDFTFARDHAAVVGPGLPFGELEPGRWYRGYGVVTGVYPGGHDALRLALRTYQKTLRRYLPERDAMLMMNTWGDRNRDARINDAFLRAEVDAATRLGLSHFQIDDGWQQGLSQNSAKRAGRKWAAWEAADWQPHTERLPDGLGPIARYAAERDMALGLWFNPTRADSYATWERDAAIVLDLHRRYDMRYFKIDGMELPDKAADDRFRRFCEHLLEASRGDIVLHLDATAGQRLGYHYLTHLGVTFLQNRYTDWANYYPHTTLRNLWMLAHYVPPERLQIEFLNLWRNADAYRADDPLAPVRIPFDYAFAITLVAQPLAWFEASGLPEEAFAIAPLVRLYRELQPQIHAGHILPIGDEPDGHRWTGFQSILDDSSGFILVLRENHPADTHPVGTLLPAGSSVELSPVWPAGPVRLGRVENDRTLDFCLPAPFAFELLRYRVVEPSGPTNSPPAP